MLAQGVLPLHLIVDIQNIPPNPSCLLPFWDLDFAMVWGLAKQLPAQQWYVQKYPRCGSDIKSVSL